jgi:hypothetical protein
VPGSAPSSPPCRPSQPPERSVTSLRSCRPIHPPDPSPSAHSRLRTCVDASALRIHSGPRCQGDSWTCVPQKGAVTVLGPPASPSIRLSPSLSPFGYLPSIAPLPRQRLTSSFATSQFFSEARPLAAPSLAPPLALESPIPCISSFPLPRSLLFFTLSIGCTQTCSTLTHDHVPSAPPRLSSPYALCIPATAGGNPGLLGVVAPYCPDCFPFSNLCSDAPYLRRLPHLSAPPPIPGHYPGRPPGDQSVAGRPTLGAWPPAPSQSPPHPRGRVPYAPFRCL